MGVQERVYNQPVTLYTVIISGTQQRMIRTFIANAHWQENSIRITTTTGNVGSTATVGSYNIIIPRYNINREEYPIQLRPKQWAAISNAEHIANEGKYYTATLTTALIPRPTVILQGDAPFSNSAWLDAGAMGQWVTNILINNTQGYTALSVSDSNFAWYGAEKLHHMQVR